ncbi:hypothetical protein [Aeromonas caviae]|uniref:hypothetical protein n=1 Tax=Aeromonas caviae TaxID=648 RepID=UPI002B481E03|nr:hypothetical protein [Aeromonas caviae]
MQGTKIPFGERDSVLLRAFEVANGLACHCICPGCRKPLVAANQGVKVIPYFRHAQAEGCARGYKEGVRRAAVALIVAQRHLTLPAYYHQINATTHSGSTLRSDVTFPSEVILADNVERFVDLGTVRAHVVITKAERQLLVWVKVSSRTQHERHQHLASIEASSMEIDLCRLTLEQINDPATFEYAVLSNPDNRTWIRSLRGERIEQRTAETLAAEVAADNARWEQERVRRQAIEAALRADHEAKIAAAAQALAAQRKQRLATVEAQRVMDRDACLQRSVLIVSQVHRAAREWGGEAVECSTCYLLSPPGTQSCPYCARGATSMSPFTVSADYAATIHHRMRSSPKPNRSVQAAPILRIQPEQPDD